MHLSIIQTLRFRLSVLALAAAFVGCGSRTMLVSSPAALPQGMVVVGEGEAKASPDIARTNLGVEVRAATVEEATLAANQRMTAVINALKGAGVAEKDLRTQNFSINFEQEQMPPGPMPHQEMAPSSRGSAGAAEGTTVKGPSGGPRGFYRVNNMVEATIRDLKRVGDVLKAATDAGANNVWGISFELEDPKPLLEEARIKAMTHAKRNAEALAKLAGVKLGPIVAINENPQGGGPVPMMRMASMQREMADTSVPVEGGDITVTQQVQLVYALP